MARRTAPRAADVSWRNVRDIFLVSCHLRRSHTVVVPGSVANLGGGFDTLGVAVQLYLRARIVDVRDDGAAGPRCRAEHAAGQGAERPRARLRRVLERTGRHGTGRDGRGRQRHPDGGRARQQRRGHGGRAPHLRAGHRPADRRRTAGAGHRGRGSRRQRRAGAVRRADVGALRDEADGDPIALRWTWPDESAAGGRDAGRRAGDREGARGAAGHAARGATRSSTCSACCRSCTRCRRETTSGLREAVRTAGTSRRARRWCRCWREVLAIDDPDVLGAFLSGAGPSVAVAGAAGTSTAWSSC